MNVLKKKEKRKMKATKRRRDPRRISNTGTRLVTLVEGLEQGTTTFPLGKRSLETGQQEKLGNVERICR